MKNSDNKIISLDKLAALSVIISLSMNVAIFLSFWFGDGIMFMHDPTVSLHFMYQASSSTPYMWRCSLLSFIC